MYAKLVWDQLSKAFPNPIKFEKILLNIKHQNGSISPNISSILSKLYKKNILIWDSLGIRFNQNFDFVSRSIHDGVPYKLDGTWCVRILHECSHSPTANTNDLVFVTTRANKLLGPYQIVGVEKIKGKFIYKTTENIGVKETVDVKEESVTTQLIDEPKKQHSSVELDKIIRETLGQYKEETYKALQKDIQDNIKEVATNLIRPTLIEIKEPDKSSVKIEGAHYLFPRLLKLISAGFNVFMWGPPGTGKTTAAMQVAEALGRKSEIDTLDPTTARSMVQGYMTPTGEHVHNVFTRCWEQGALYIADEVDLAPGHVQTLFNSALANGWAPLAWGNTQQASDFGFVATGNTAGRPNAAFPDRRPMSNAFADRLYFLHWPLDPSIECRAAGLPPPTIKTEKSEECSAKDWVRFVQRLREWAAKNAPTLSVTPRASLLGIKALALGESPTQVANALIFRGCDNEIRKKALLNVWWKE